MAGLSPWNPGVVAVRHVIVPVNDVKSNQDDEDKDKDDCNNNNQKKGRAGFVSCQNGQIMKSTIP